MKSRANVGPSKVNGNVISDIKEMSAVHNKYFTSLLTKEMAGPVPKTVTLPTLTSISNMVFSESQVKKSCYVARFLAQTGSH